MEDNVRISDASKEVPLEGRDQEGSTNAPCTDVRVCVVGNVDSGKSTLIGVLTAGDLDNGACGMWYAP